MNPPDHPGRFCPENPRNKAKAQAGSFKALLLHFCVVLLAIFVTIMFIGIGADAAESQQPLLP